LHTFRNELLIRTIGRYETLGLLFSRLSRYNEPRGRLRPEVSYDELSYPLSADAR
jgi:hypothetical protein